MTLQIIIASLIRHALTMSGGGVLVEGMLTGDLVNQIAGTLASVVGIGLSLLDKRK